MHVIVEDPKIREAFFIKLILLIAAELIETLSAPEFKKSSICSTVLIPPPTERGINKFFEVLVTNLVRLFVPYSDATLSI